mmetsp:Transcript_124741/g.216256  ORF Transcript_124741/g.216256 Transcript_124741/m.216256 type:complete len:332 (-) Transcript_124741:149-1144(-)
MTDPFVVPTKMPKYAQTYVWPEESVFYKSQLFMYEDVKAMLADDYPFLRDTMLLAAGKFISDADKCAVNIASPTMGNTLAVWDYVNKHDDVITGAIFKAAKKPKKATEMKISKEALKEATKGKHSSIIPAAGRADHPAAVLPKAPQQIVLWGNAMTDGSVTAWGTDFSVLLNAMSQAGARIPILVMTRGSYGRFMGESVAANWNNASSMSMWGLVRTARQEIPNIPMLLVEVPYGTPLAEIPRCLTPSDSEQCYYHGVKFLPQIEQVPSLAKKAEQTPGLGAAKTGGAKPMFTRKMFNWGRPEGKLDNVWFRQKWVSMGPAWGEMPMRKSA